MELRDRYEAVGTFFLSLFRGQGEGGTIKHTQLLCGWQGRLSQLECSGWPCLLASQMRREGTVAYDGSGDMSSQGMPGASLAVG